MKGPIALTGSTGFVGRHLVKALSEAGWALRLLVREGPRDCGFGTAETVIGSLDDDAALSALVTGTQAVIHVAGAIAAPDRASFFAINVRGSEKIARAAMAAEVPRFIHVSSLAAREAQLSDYAASKRAAEDALMTLKPQGLIIVRPPAVYGPGDRATLPLLAQFTRRVAFIPSSAQARFSLLYVEDLVKFLAARLTDGALGLHEIDDGTPRGYGWPDLAAIAGQSEGHDVRLIFLPHWLLRGLASPLELASSLAGFSMPLKVGKVSELYHPDWVARGSALETSDRTKLAEGFARTIAWYREQGWLPPKAQADRRQSAKLYGENSK